MPGIYIHIPFCRKACHYCDFHFSTSLKNKNELVAALIKELEHQRKYLGTEEISTLYFGGGTPSLLSPDDINRIIDAVVSHYRLASSAEITLEVNPDDLDTRKIKGLKAIGINRLSIGVQSFFDDDLMLINRTHSGKQAITAIQTAQDNGFQNLTIDLMYGLPGLTERKWEDNLQQMFQLEIPHLSAYCLTVEAKTALHHFIKTGKVSLPPEDVVIKQYEKLVKKTEQNGFIHYEISNFCQPGMHSKHNSSYWNNENYLGIGPSAHSYNGASRQWNAANNAVYIRSIGSGKRWFEREFLTTSDKYNEYLMTRLRTITGIHLEYIRKTYGKEREAALLQQLSPIIADGLMEQEKENVFLTRKGKLFADKITAGLFI